MEHVEAPSRSLPKPNGERRQVVGFSVLPSLHDRLRAAAQAKGVTMSRLMEEWLSTLPGVEDGAGCT